MTVEISDWLPAPIRLPNHARPDDAGLDIVHAGQEFAIGDVHGHVGLFWALLDAMAAVAGPAAHLTLLGDLIDRGPSSLACLRVAAMDARSLGFASRTMLLGNHEIAMLMAITSTGAADARALWVANGGMTTLAEAGVTPAALARATEDATARLRDAVGAAALAMLDAAQLSRRVGNLVFVHGGVDPAIGIADFLAGPRLWIASEHHPAWIRAPFLLHEGGFEGGAIIVHGHTPEPIVLDMKGRGRLVGHHRLDHGRLGLDGGSYGTGVVAGAEFRDGGYRVFTARAPFG